MYKTSTGLKPLHISFNKMDESIIILDGKIKHLILFDFGLFNKVCNKINGVIKIVLIIILEISELIHIILYLLKK